MWFQMEKEMEISVDVAIVNANDLVVGRKYIIITYLHREISMVGVFHNSFLPFTSKTPYDENIYSYFVSIQHKNHHNYNVIEPLLLHNNGYCYYDVPETIALKKQVEKENHTIQLVFLRKRIPHVLSLYVNEYNVFV